MFFFIVPQKGNFYKGAFIYCVMVYVPDTKMAARYREIVRLISDRELYDGRALTERGRAVVWQGFSNLESVMDILLARVSPLSSGREALHYNLACYLWHLLGSENKNILHNSAKRTQLPVAIFPLLASYYIMEERMKREPTNSYTL